MRLFIAIDLDSGKELFSSIQHKLDKRAARLSISHTYHITLKFLGEVADDTVAEIQRRLAMVQFKQFKISTDRMGVFPSATNIRVIWVGFDNEKDLIELGHQVDAVLKDMFAPCVDFQPHLTLARVKLLNNKKQLRDSLDNIKVEKKEFTVTEFKLMKSTLTPAGAIYEELTTYTLF